MRLYQLAIIIILFHISIGKASSESDREKILSISFIHIGYRPSAVSPVILYTNTLGINPALAFFDREFIGMQSDIHADMDKITPEAAKQLAIFIRKNGAMKKAATIKFGESQVTIIDGNKKVDNRYLQGSVLPKLAEILSTQFSGEPLSFSKYRKLLNQ